MSTCLRGVRRRARAAELLRVSLLAVLALSACDPRGGPGLRVGYNANGSNWGSVPEDPRVYRPGDTVTVLGNTGSLSRVDSSGFVWNLAADGTGTAYEPGSTFTMGPWDVTLYAHWNTGIAVEFAAVQDETISLGPEQSLSQSATLSVAIAETFDEYRWYLDGDLLTGESAPALSLVLTTHSYGPHVLHAVVRKGGSWFSKTLRFYVKA